ncbi:MAG: type 4a pilus biogenesis protein PilO [Candidatus Omnitrophota bacterium]
MKKLDVSFLSDKQIKEMIVFTLLTLIIIIFDFSFVLKKQFANLSVLGPKIAQARKNIKESSLNEYRVDTLKRRLDELVADVEAKKKGILNEDQIPSLMEEISKLADKVNLKIMQLKPSPELSDKDKFSAKSGEEYYPIALSILAKGSYHSLGQFLNGLETNNVFIKVKNIDIVPQGTAASSHDIKLSALVFVVKKTGK